MGGWLEKVKIKLNLTQVVVEVEVRFEHGQSVSNTNVVIDFCIMILYIE